MLPQRCPSPFGTPGGQAVARAALSICLRAATEAEHCEVERAIGLPRSIGSRADYVSCLQRFYGLYCPLEERLATFEGWGELRIDLSSRSQSARIAADLLDLTGERPSSRHAPQTAMPSLPGFANAVGAFYVLEGSSLGGHVIHRALVAAGIDGVSGTSTFFARQQPAAASGWTAFRAALDDYGYRYDTDHSQVIVGAKETFLAIGHWMRASSWKVA